MSSLANSSTAPTGSSSKDSNCNQDTSPPLTLVDLDTKNTFFKGPVFLESINTKKINALLKSKDILKIHEDFINGKKWKFDDRKSLLKILKRTAVDNTMKVQYTSQTNYGRVYPVGCMSIGQLKREIRHYVCDNYYDIDIKNAHPVCLMNVCKEMNIPCDRLNDYCKNRKQIIKSYNKKYGMSRDETKRLYIAMINCANYKKYFPEKHIRKRKNHAKEFYNEMNTTVRVISKKSLELRKKLLNGVENPWDGSFMSRYLQMYECMILEEAYKYCLKQEVIGSDNNCVLAHDGIMIPKSRFKSEEECRIFLKEKLNTHIYETLGFKLEFVLKPMDEHYIEKDGEMVDIATEIEAQGIDANQEYWSDYRLKYGIGKDTFPKSCDDYDLAKLFYEPQEDSYVFTTIAKENRCGFEFNKYGLYKSILEDTFSDVVVEFFQPLLKNLDSLCITKSGEINKEIEKLAEAIGETKDDKEVNRLTKEQDKLKAEILRIRKLTSDITKKINNTASLKKLVVRIIQHYTDGKFEDKLDKDSNLLGFDNGVIDLNNIDEGIRPAKKGEYINMTCGYKYHKANKTLKDKVKGYIRDMFPDDETTDEVLIYLSRALKGTNEDEKFLALRGDGRNGKGLLMGGMMAGALGGNVPNNKGYFKMMEWYVFTEDPKKKKGTLNDHLHSLQRKRLLTVPEVPDGVVFHTNMFRRITGNDDINVRTLFKTGVSFKMGILVSEMNGVMTFSDSTEAPNMKERIIGVEMENTFKSQADYNEMKKNNEDMDKIRIKDRTLKPKFLHNTEYKCAVMDLLLEYYKKYTMREEGNKIRRTEFIKESTTKLFKNLSPDRDWFDNNLDKNGEVEKKKNYLVRPLWREYRGDEESPVKFNWFKNKLLEFGFTYETRVMGIDINTGHKKQGACVMNVEYIGQEATPDTFTWEQEED